MIKVFLSHQRADAGKAGEIAARLKVYHQIDSYLDVIDPFLGRPGTDLAAHIRSEMSKCTQLLAVVSSATPNSQWVPWEIGVASEKDYPLATFSNYASLVPEFLRSWPYLTSMVDVDAYALASKKAENERVVKEYRTTASAARRETTGSFFGDLRARLGQR
jgi:hypothetical protein